MKKQDNEELRVSHWFAGQPASQLTRRQEVWTLLGWYHHKVVEPQLGFAGAFRRLWWQLSGQTWRLSPWRDLQERIARKKAERAVKEGHQRAIASNGTKPPAPVAEAAGR